MEERVMEKEQRWKSLRLRGLRQRWIFNSILPVLALLVLVRDVMEACVDVLGFSVPEKM